jgi:hypothetical protein
MGLLLMNLTTASAISVSLQAPKDGCGRGPTTSFAHHESWTRLQSVVTYQLRSGEIWVDLLLQALHFDFIVVDGYSCCIAVISATPS